MTGFRFERLGSECAARRARLHFARGTVETPAFMPVGTYGTVKSLTPEEVAGTGAEILLGNTFHLWLRPGTEIIRAHGDLHDFMGWSGPILTDSGGFQVWSLAQLRRIDESGVRFRAPTNGDEVFLSPEESMRIQRDLGSDVVMAFDECTAHPAPREAVAASMRLSMRWAVRCRDAHAALDNPNALFGIVQGGMEGDLRQESAEALVRIGFPGYAIGGLAVGEEKAVRERVVEETVAHLPEDAPRYLMGVGKPEDIVAAVTRGVDMFDCVLPTRNARNGHLFTANGDIRLKNARFPHRPAPARRGLRLLHLPALLPKLPPPLVPLQRDPRRAAEHPAQRPLLPDVDGGAQGGDRGGPVGLPSRATFTPGVRAGASGRGRARSTIAGPTLPASDRLQPPAGGHPGSGLASIAPPPRTDRRAGGPCDNRGSTPVPGRPRCAGVDGPTPYRTENRR